jgi:hypothetical protein
VTPLTTSLTLLDWIDDSQLHVFGSVLVSSMRRSLAE